MIGAKPKDAILRDIGTAPGLTAPARVARCGPHPVGRRLDSRARLPASATDGPEVLDIQQRLVGLGFAVAPGELAGWFGPSDRRPPCARSRIARQLRVDGVVGPDTWGQLVEAGFRLGDRTLYLHAPPFRGDDVRDLQRKLNALGFDAGT